MSQVQQLDPMKTKRSKLLQAKSSNFTYNRSCYKIRNFIENVVFVTNNEPSPATWPKENKKIKKYCRPSPATWPTIAFVTKLETLMKMLFLFSTMRQVQQLDPMKRRWTIIASQVQQLDPMKTKNKKYCRPSPATWPTTAFVTKLEALMKM